MESVKVLYHLLYLLYTNFGKESNFEKLKDYPGV